MPVFLQREQPLDHLPGGVQDSASAPSCPDDDAGRFSDAENLFEKDSVFFCCRSILLPDL
jgi:hypothetical protein